MKNNLLLYVVVLIIVSIRSLAISGEIVSGVVVDPNDRPIENATVTLVKGNTESTSIITGADGKFAIYDNDEVGINKTIPQSKNLTVTLSESSLMFSLTSGEHLNIGIYNALGREMFTVNEFHQIGNYIYDIPNLASGVYLMKGIVGTQILAQKILMNETVNIIQPVLTKHTLARSRFQSDDSLIFSHHEFESMGFPLTETGNDVGIVKLLGRLIVTSSGGSGIAYGSRGLESANVIINAHNGFLIGGHTSFEGSGYKTVRLFQIDELGDTLWSKTYDHMHSTVNDITLSPDGYIAVGYKENRTAADAFIIKINMDGDTLWTKTLGNISKHESFNSIIAINDGYIAVGRCSSNGTNVFVVKFTDSGEILWTKDLGSTKDQFGNDIVAVEDGFIISGGIYESSGFLNGLILKIDSLGNLIWTKEYGDESNDILKSICTSNDYGYVLSGYSRSLSNRSNDIWILKINDTGETLWSEKYGTSYTEFSEFNDEANDMISVSDGYLLCGESGSVGKSAEFLVLKIDESGDTLWTQKYGESEDDVANSIVLNNKNECIVVGKSENYGVSREYYNTWGVKIDSLGNTLWDR